MSQAFDANSFIDATMNQPLEKRDPIPAENPETSDGLYLAIMGEPKPRQWTGRQDPTKTGYAMDIPIEIQVPGSLQAGPQKFQPVIKLTYGVMLDLNETGGLDMGKGKNGGIRRLRESLDLNKAGDSFSFRKLAGQPCKVKIKHRVYEGEILDDIDALFKA